MAANKIGMRKSEAGLTMEDLATLAGVSTITVSRALRDSPLVTAQTRDKVRRIADGILDETFQTSLSGSSREYEESSSNIGFAFQEPEQLMYNTFQVQLFGSDHWKTLTQIKPHLVSKTTGCTGTRSVGFGDAIIHYMLK